MRHTITMYSCSAESPVISFHILTTPLPGRQVWPQVHHQRARRHPCTAFPSGAAPIFEPPRWVTVFRLNRLPACCVSIIS